MRVILLALFLSIPVVGVALEYTNDSTIIRLGVSGAPQGGSGQGGGDENGGGSSGGTGTGSAAPAVTDISTVSGRTNTPSGTNSSGGIGEDSSGGGESSAAAESGSTSGSTGIVPVGMGSGNSDAGGTSSGASAMPSADDPSWVTYSGIGSSGSDSLGGMGEAERPSVEARAEVYQGLVSSGAINFVPDAAPVGGSAGPEGVRIVSGSVAASGGGGLAGTMTVVGTAVRAVFQSQVDALDIMLDDWNYGPPAKGTATPEEYGIAAASAIIYNTGIDEITFHATRMDIAYRARGLLFFVIPWKMPIKLSVDPNAAAASRVSMQLPWYQFLVWKSFSRDRVIRDIGALLDAQSRVVAPSADPHIILFRAVTSLLRNEAGMVH